MSARGGRESPVYALAVRDLPRATGYRVRYEYPAYTGLKSEESQAITGHVAAPRGTRARVEVTLSRSVRSAARCSTDAGATRRQARARVGRLHRADPKRRPLRHALRGRARSPRRPRPVRDPRHPRPAADGGRARPGPSRTCGRDLTAVVIAGATDDYGVKRILIRYSVRGGPEKTETLHEEKGASRGLAVRYTWSLSGFSLLPGEEVEYRIGAVTETPSTGPRRPGPTRASSVPVGHGDPRLHVGRAGRDDRLPGGRLARRARAPRRPRSSRATSAARAR